MATASRLVIARPVLKLVAAIRNSQRQVYVPQWVTASGGRIATPACALVRNDRESTIMVSCMGKLLFMGIGFTQQTITAYIVGAVHERPGSIKSVFRIRPGAFVGCGLREPC